MKQDNTNVTPWMSWDSKSVTFSDCGRILKQIQEDLKNDNVPPHVLHQLYLITSVSKKYDAENIPDDIVTMNSEILVTLDNRKEQKIRIVFPGDVRNPGDISIYSPMGAACLGEHENTRVSFFDGAGYNQAVIEKVLFQPEKEKLFYL